MNISKKTILFVLAGLMAGSAAAGPDFVMLQQARKNQLIREQKARQASQKPEEHKKQAAGNTGSANEPALQPAAPGTDK
ncbi:hypothetical protein ACO0LO_28230 [Undibacterium sp. TJN25]|uniref:hypothetical protein n=1 Tax=Undibacterium sp. TJN25 TaxID=3413056 RepID=UPI003BF066FD